MTSNRRQVKKTIMKGSFDKVKEEKKRRVRDMKDMSASQQKKVLAKERRQKRRGEQGKLDEELGRLYQAIIQVRHANAQKGLGSGTPSYKPHLDFAGRTS